MNPLIGVRAWRYHAGHQLRSTMYWRHVWSVSDKTTAACLRHRQLLSRCDAPIRPNNPPARGCSCGVYARTDLSGVIEEYPLYPRSHAAIVSTGDMCMGAVLMTGEVAWGDKVIRAAEGRPLCLCEPQTAVDPQRQAMLEAIAHHNQIPLVPWAHVLDYVSEFGDLVRGPARVRGSMGPSDLRWMAS
jgi:hypothetical protein